MNSNARFLILRTLRFGFTVLPPLVIAYFYGIGSWILYLIFGAILGFVGDIGGKPLSRFLFISLTPFTLLVGSILGTLSFFINDAIFFGLAISIGVLYGLFEGLDDHITQALRFLGYGLVFGYAIKQITAIDIGLTILTTFWAFFLSLLWDRVFNLPMKNVSFRKITTILSNIHIYTSSRWIFALSAGISVALSYIVCIFTGNTHAYWSILTILIVLHQDMINSASHITERITGTLLGVFIVVLLVLIKVDSPILLGAAMLIALLRLPAFHLHSILGTACVTAFVLLLGELSISNNEDEMIILIDRLLATFIGCSFALFAIQLDKTFSYWKKK